MEGFKKGTTDFWGKGFRVLFYVSYIWYIMVQKTTQKVLRNSDVNCVTTDAVT